MKLKLLAKDTAVYGMSDLSTKLLAFAAFPLLAAALSPTAYGSLELVVTAIGLLGLLVNFGLNNAVQRYYWDDAPSTSPRATIVSTGLTAQVLLGISIFIAGLLALPWLGLTEEQLPLIGRIGLAAALMLLVLQQWNQYVLDVLRLHFAPWRYLAASLASRVATTAAALVVVLGMGLGLDGLLVAQAAVALLALPLGLMMIRKDLAPVFDTRLAKKLMSFGHPFIYVGLAYWLLTSMDRWMLAAMSTVEDVGVYSVASRYASAVLLVSGAFGQAWSPASFRLRSEEPTRYRAVFGQVLLLLFSLTMAVGCGLMLFAGEVIALTMPEEYAGAAVPMAVLVFGLVLQSTSQVTATGISIEQKTHLFARIMWLAAAVNFGLNLLFIPKHGATGAAWATTLSTRSCPRRTSS